MTYHLAIDIGASSGRHIVGWVQDGRMHLKEVYRFENRLVEKNGHLCWEMDRLWQNVLAGLKACRDAGYTPATLGIDTWAVDFVLLDEAGQLLGDTVAYRDGRTAGERDRLAGTLPFAEHYARTGIQYQPFNTAYQNLFDGAGLPQLQADRRRRQRVHQRLHHRAGGGRQPGLGR